ncbi:MAG: universal stress protein [Laribacter sp.]|nr:universal stress protein [Laribacter sp.]MBP9527650.1 universal stress protein [Laribacter sp.]MBP9608163.1 universal stress protein [Laribacter sp.]
MTDFHRILTATDLSAPARHAAERAALVSQEIMATLHLLHIPHLASLERLQQLAVPGEERMETRIQTQAQQRLDALATALEQRFGTCPVTHVEAGPLLPTLRRMISAITADLLVCGAKGESLVRHHLLGTTAHRMISTATCPVLVVKQTAHEPYRRLLVPVDFSPASSRAIRHALALAPQAEIVLLHAFEVPFEGQLRYAGVDGQTLRQYRSQMKQQATEKLQGLRETTGLSAGRCESVILYGHPAFHILEQEQIQDCDLIVMGKQGESMIETLLLGSVTKHVLAESHGDILVSV